MPWPGRQTHCFDVVAGADLRLVADNSTAHSPHLWRALLTPASAFG